MSAFSITCLNGVFVPAEAALLPVADRGFRFGDGVFETIRLAQGKPYQLPVHLARLNAGLQALRITPPAVDWAVVVQSMIEHNSAHEGFLRLAVSRGVGSKGYLPSAATPNWVIEYLPALALPEQPCTLWLSRVTRPSLSCLPGNQKISAGIGSTLALLDAHDHGCEEALLLNGAGQVCEAASANLFWTVDDRLFTPALAAGCVDGTTRAAVMRLSPVLVEEVTIPLSNLTYADSMFLTNVRLGIWPVIEVKPISWRCHSPNPLLAELQARLDADRTT